ncbi:hypothetical protein DPMN_089689 [Dreissena polymorpha]|uniref:Uncharacterized protein n=1 Tax=Dreissena polymorpha TaxID=45954 RepID=A0A9D4KXB8_DREPO|nr:hypothetical protein DPMN_089689 [Dreissena polymorpha]
MDCNNSKDVSHIVSNFTCFKQRSQCINIIRTTVGVAGCLENTFTRSSCLCDYPEYDFENRQRVNKTANTITKRFKRVFVQQCTNQNRKIKPAPIMSNKNGSVKLCKPHHTIM